MLNILIVDDSAFIREILKSAIIKLGHHVAGEACDGESAIEAAKALKPDVIFMDIVLPKKNGIQATQEILKSFPNIKIIACTSIEEQSVLSQAIQAGCATYLSKPFNKQDIERAISITNYLGEAANG